MASAVKVAGTAIVYLVSSGVAYAVASRALISAEDRARLSLPVRGYPLGPTDEERAFARRMLPRVIVAGGISTVAGATLAYIAYKRA